MNKLKTIFCSNIPVECYIVKGRLEREGFSCFVFDEHLVGVHPFKAVAVGGVKLKVLRQEFARAQAVLNDLEVGKLRDENGSYELSQVFHEEYKRQEEVLRIKAEIRKNGSLASQPDTGNASLLQQEEIDSILESEKEIQQQANTKLNFSWKDFFYELLDFDRDVFAYLRFRPVEYYLEKELVDVYTRPSETLRISPCPQCKSGNTHNGYAIDFRWSILYLLLSFLFYTPFPLMRKKWHCFDCGHNYKNAKLVDKAHVNLQT